MSKFDLEKLRPKLDLEGKYVDFSSIRTAVSILTIVESLAIKVSEPNKDGEARGDCPKCKKARSFAFNINSNRFNCFNKGCGFRGGGAIDFASKLFEVSAKEASHLLAYAYGIQPYTADDGGDGQTVPVDVVEQSREASEPRAPDAESDYVSRKEFEKLKTEFDRFRNVVYVYMLENDRTEFEPETTKLLQKADQIQ